MISSAGVVAPGTVHAPRFSLIAHPWPFIGYLSSFIVHPFPV
jgi:hypothetical protein